MIFGKMETREKITTNVKESSVKSPDKVRLRPVKERIPWQRFTLSLIGIGIIIGKWQWATWHLYSLPVTSVSSFTTITTNDSYVIAAIVIFMITGKLVYDWKNQSVSNIVTQAEAISEHIRKDENQNVNIKEEYTEHVDESARNENLREFLD